MKSITLLSFLLLLSSCGFAKKFNSIKIDSLKYIDRANVKKIIGEDYKVPIVNYWSEGDFIVVSLTIKNDLIDYLKKDNSTFHQNAYFCNQKNDVVLLGLSTIYKNGISSVDVYSKDVFYNLLPNDVYKFIIFTSWQKDRNLQESLRKNKSQEYYLKYDFRREAKDICITLSGTNMMSNYETNEVIITKKQIEEVLKNN